MTTLRRPPKFRLGDAAAEAKRLAERQQYSLPVRPGKAIPVVPDDPTELDDPDLITMMTQLTRWAEHLGVQLAMAEVDERHAEAAMEKFKALALLAGTDKDVTRTKARAYESPEFLEAEETYQEAMAYRKLIDVLYRNAERWANLISRELTRRVNLAPQTRRANRGDT